MEISFEPTNNGMQRIYFAFCEDKPEPEDLWVRRALSSPPMPPKRVTEEERDGLRYTVLQWGQCIIGEAMYDIEKHAGIVQRIQDLCGEQITASGLDRDERNRRISAVALEFHSETKILFEVDERMEIVIDDKLLLARMLEELTVASG